MKKRIGMGIGAGILAGPGYTAAFSKEPRTMLLRNAFSFLIVIGAFTGALADIESPSEVTPEEIIIEEALIDIVPEELSKQLPKQSQVGMEDVMIYHRSVIQVGKDLEQWISSSRAGTAKIVSQSADLKACYNGRGALYCEKAIQALYPFSVIPLKDDKIFELGRRLREGNFEFQIGVRIFKLTSALRFFVKEEVYNGVKVPTSATASQVRKFVSEMQSFQETKVIDLKKGRANIPPLPGSRR